MFKIAAICRTAAYLFVVFLIGGLAIAWKPQSPIVNAAATINPYELQLGSQSLPTQEVNDMTFVFTNEH
jgi:hypothetical protein